jgi:flagellin-specific chaperone FliS
MNGKYSKRYLNEKWERIKWDVEQILLADPENDYVEFPEGRSIRENLRDGWNSIAKELDL